MKKVRDGYKMTELGEIPSEWEVKNIGEVAKFQGGYAFKSSDYVEDGIRLVKITNAQQKNISWNEEDLLPVKYLEKFNEYKLQEDDVVIAMTRPIISTGIKVCKIEKRDLPCLLNQRVGRFIIKDLLISKYLYNYCFTDYFINKVKELCSTTGQPNISANQIESILITIPSVKEQEKITSILSTVDEQIDNVDALIEKNKELKKGLMQTLLTKGIGHTKFKTTEIGEIPEEWQVKRLGNVCEVKSSKRVYQSDYIDSGVPFYRSKEIIELSKGNLPTVELFIARDKFEEFKEKYGVPKLGDLMITSVGSVGKTWVCDGREFYYKDGNLTQIISNNEINTKYISYVFECEYLIKQYLGQSSGSAQVALTLEKLKNLLVIFPTIDEQVSIVNILLSIDKKIEEYENKKKKLEELKKGLMQQLLTGKIRV